MKTFWSKTASDCCDRGHVCPLSVLYNIHSALSLSGPCLNADNLLIPHWLAEVNAPPFSALLEI